jgi:hypothetical protein
VILNPIVIVVFEKAAGVGAGYEVVMPEATVDDGGTYGIDEFFGTGEIRAGGSFLCPDGACDKGKD